jgi:hypothetical protein
MSNTQPAQGTWFKSSYSSSEGGDCVEVRTGPDTILIRDSKNTTGPRLAITPGSWAAFVEGLPR